MTTRYVFAVGGARIGYHVGLYNTLVDGKDYQKADAVYGESSGAIIAAFLATGHTTAEMADIVFNTSKKAIIRGPFYPGILFGWPLYSTKPLRKFLAKHLEGKRIVLPAKVGRVNNRTGHYEQIELDSSNIVESVYASSTMPVAMKSFDRNFDGGLRVPTPLMAAVEDAGLDDLIIVSSPHALSGVKGDTKESRHPFAELFRSIDVMQNELVRQSIEPFVTMNAILRDKAPLGWYNRAKNKTYYPYNLQVFAPTQPLPIGSLEFEKMPTGYHFGRHAALAGPCR